MKKLKSNKNRLISIFLIILTILIISCTLQASFAVDQTVNPGATPSTTVQNNISAAITAANSGDTITIQPGTYQGINNNTNLTINKNLTIKGNGPHSSVIIDAQHKSQIFFLTNNITLTFINISFINGNGSLGGAIGDDGSSMYGSSYQITKTFMNCSFYNNDADANGGAIWNTGDNLTVTNCIFIGNSAVGGGAIYNMFAKNLKVNNCIFEDNHAIGNAGGAIYTAGINSTITNSTFRKNSADYVGGAIHFHEYSGFSTVANSNFFDNSAGVDGGAIHNFDVNHANDCHNRLIINCNFKGNYAGHAGGAIYHCVGDNFTVANSTFIENQAGSYGGAILLNNQGDNITIANSTFTDNYASYGGAICNVKLNGLEGQIYVGGLNVLVANSTFTFNTAKTAGGAIFNNGTNMTVINSTFTNNTAQGGNYFTEGGGAIYNTYHCNMTVKNSTFINNTAYMAGGGIFNSANGTIITNSTFINNTASVGGGIFNAGYDASIGLMYNAANVIVANSTFINNTAVGGGGIANFGITMTVSNSTFINNSVTGFGGGIYNEGTMRVYNNTMTGNIAITLGNVIYNEGQMGILNLTYLSNTTITVARGQVVPIYVTLTDDMGNPVTGQNISFYLNGTIDLGNVTVIEGYAFVNHPIPLSAAPGFYAYVTGDYAGHTGYNIVLRNGEIRVAENFTITKTVNVTGDVLVGSTVRYTVNVTNIGSSPITGIMVNDTIPVGTSYYNHTVTHGSYNSTTGNWTIPSLAAGDSAILTVDVIVNVVGNITNTASINETNVSVTFKSVNLTITKVANVTQVLVGGSVRYTITVTNTGSNNATNIIVIETLPPGVTYTDHSIPSGSTFNNSTFLWNITSLANGSSISMNITVKVDVVGDITNNVTINGTNLTANATFRSVNMALNKSVNVTQAIVGSNVTYTITVTNTGSTTATNVIVNETLPPGVSHVSNTGGTSYNDVTGVWTITSLAPGASISMNITVKVDVVGDITNNVTINGTNLTANATFRSINLTITKVANVTQVIVGDMVRYTITVTNVGSTTATNIIVNETLPLSGVTYRGHYDPLGTFDNSTFLWNISSLAAGASVNMTIDVTVDIVGNVTNVVCINGTNLTANETVKGVNLTVNKSSNVTGDVLVGGSVLYNITVTNTGSNTATNIIVLETLPAGVIYDSHIPVTGTYFDPVDGVWTIYSLASGDSVTLTIVVNVTATGNLTNTVRINNTNVSDNETFTAINLTITKVANVTQVIVGDMVRYTITVTNVGSTTATNIIVNESLPLTGVTYRGHYDPLGTFDNSTFLWTIDSLAAGDSVTLTIDVTVDVIGNVTNVVCINGTNLTANETVRGVNLTVNKSSNVTGDVLVGGSVLYNITVTNTGSNTATNIIVLETLPAGVIYDSHIPVTGTYFDPVDGVWTIYSLASGDSVTLTIIVNVTATGNLTNTVRINGTNVSDNETFTSVNYTITKSVNVTGDVLVGSIVRYTIVVECFGNATATNIEVMEYLPAGVYYDSHVNDTGYYNSSTGVWFIPSLTNGTNATLTIDVIVIVTGNLTNIVRINGTNVSDNETFTSVNYTITKSVNVTSDVWVGSTVEYTITVYNTGNTNATNIIVIEDLPSGVSYDSHVADSGNYDDATGVWTIPSLANGTNVSLTIVVTVEATGNLTNIVRINGTNISDEVDINSVGLTIVKTVDVLGDVLVGSIVRYTITVYNTANTTATNVNVIEYLPGEVTYLDHVADTGDYNSTTGVWFIPSLANGTNVSLTINVTADVVGNITNIVVINGTPIGNNTTFTCINLTVTKSVNVTEDVLIGSTVRYTITVYNTGNTTATNVTVVDYLPGEVTYLDHVADTGYYNSSTGLWFIPSLANGTNVSLTIDVTADVTGNITNFVVVNSSTPIGNNTTFTCVNLTVKKTANATHVLVGSNVEYIITVYCNGNASATNVVVNETLPYGLSFISGNANNGVYDHITGLWTIPTLANNTDATLTIVVKVVAVGNITNTVSVGNDSDNWTVDSEGFVNLTVVKVANVTSVFIGDTVSYTITVFNHGPNNVTGVIVNETLVDALIYINDTVSQGSYDYSTGLWSVGNMDSGSNATMVIAVKVNGTGKIDNVVSVGNNTTNVTIDSDGEVNLTVTKVANVTVIVNGLTVRYVITVTNNGPDNASNVIVNETLPSTLIYLNSVVSQGSYDPTTGLWNTGLLNNGDSANLTLVVRVNGTGNLTNNVTVKTPGNNTGDNETNETIESFPGVNLTLTKVVNVTSVLFGKTVKYTVTVFNHGHDNATNVIVNEILPSGLVYISGVVSQGSYNPATGVWNVGNLDNGYGANLVIVVKTNATGLIINGVNVTADQNNTNPVTNKSNITANITVRLDSNSSAKAPNTMVGKPITISGIARDENGDLLVKTKLAVIVDGKTFSVTTSAVGGWSLTYNPKKTGVITVIVKWTGNSTHNGFINSTNFTVKGTNDIDDDDIDPKKKNYPKNNPRENLPKTNLSKANMKNTGIPIHALLVLLATFILVATCFKKRN